MRFAQRNLLRKLKEGMESRHAFQFILSSPQAYFAYEKGARRLPFMFRDYLKIRLLYCYLLQSVAIAYCEETVLGFQQFDRQFIEGVFQHL